MKKNEDLLHSTLQGFDNEQVRKFMPRGLRRLIAFLLLLVLLVSVVVSLAAFRPVIITMTTPMFAYRQDISSDYKINLKSDAPFEQRSLPAGGAYVSDYSESVTVDFDIQQRALHLGSLVSRQQTDAILQVHAVNDPNVLLMERKINLLPPVESQPDLSSQQLRSSLTLPLAVYSQTAADFLSDSARAGEARLIIRLSAEMAGTILNQDGTSVQTADVIIPLLTESFRVQNDPVSVQHLITRPVSYLVQPTLLPAFVYPLLSSVLLLTLVLFLVLTANRPDIYFRRGLKQLLRQGRRQILMIADKAWEPEWCITVSGFDSMLQTAKRLRHPIFCYVDYESETPAAYFYVYYGENNYCFVYDGKPPRQPGRQRVPAFGLLKAPEAELDPVKLPAAGSSLAESDSDTMAAGYNSAKLPADSDSTEFTVSPAGPKLPSPEPFMDLINDPWPHHSPVDTENKTPSDREASEQVSAPESQLDSSWNGTDENSFRKNLF